MSRDRPDDQSDDRAIRRAFDSFMRLRPFLIMAGGGLATAIASTLYLSHNWEAIQGDVKAQGQTIQVHENIIRQQGIEIQNINVHFAKLEQLLIDLQNGRKTSLSTLPYNAPLAGSGSVSDTMPLPPHAGK